MVRKGRSLVAVALLAAVAAAVIIVLHRAGGTWASRQPDSDAPGDTSERADTGTATLRGAPDTPSTRGGDERGDPDEEPGIGSERQLQGRVLDRATRAPVVGAWVHCVGVHSRAARSERVLSGADGRYRLELPEVPQVRVFVLGGGWCSAHLGIAKEAGFDPFLVNVPATEEHDLLVEAVPGVSGHVYDTDGTPEPGVEVALHLGFPSGSSLRHYVWKRALTKNLTVTTDSGGAFEFGALVPGLRFALRARAAGRAVVKSPTMRAEARKDHVVDLHLMPPRRLHCRVIDTATDTGLAGVDVRANVPALHGLSESVRGTTDAYGRVTLGPIPTGPLSRLACGARKEDWVLVSPPSLEGHDPAADASLTFGMRRGLPIRGRVLEPLDVVVAGVTVVAVEVGTGRWHEAFTDDEGAFTFPCVKPGEYVVKVAGHFGEVGGYGYEECIAEQRAKAGGEAIVFRLSEVLERVTRVLVQGPDGRPVERFRYVLAWEGGSHSESDDSSGTIVVLPNDRGERAWIEVQAALGPDGEPLPYAPASIGPLAQNSGDHILRLGWGRRIEGRVLAEGGRGVPGVALEAYPVDRGAAQGRTPGSHGSGRTDDEGRFCVVGLAEGRYRLWADPGPAFAQPAPITTTAGRKDIVFHICEGITVALEVLDGQDAPVKRAHVAVRREGMGVVAQGLTGDDGVVSLDGLVADLPYTLRVQVPHDRYDLANSEHVEWRTSETRVVAAAGGFVHGTVVDEHGAPRACATVVALTGDDPEPYGFSGEDGAFWIGHLPSGRVRVLARTSGSSVRTSDPVEVEVGARDVQLLLRRSGNLTVRFLDGPANLEHREVVLRAASDPRIFLTAFVDGRHHAVFEGLAAERSYVLFERLDHGEDAMVAHAEDVPGDAQSVEIAFRPAAAIEGRVAKPDGVDYVWVRIEERGVEEKVLASADGGFLIDGLPEGEWTLTATAKDDRGQWRGTCRSRTGTSCTIDLDLVRR